MNKGSIKDYIKERCVHDILDENNNIIETREDANIEFELLTAVPYSLTVVDGVTGGNKIALMIWLCTTNLDDNKLVAIATNYQLEGDYEIDSLKELPFCDENYFVSIRLGINSIINSIDFYITDMEFSYWKEDDSEYYTFDALIENKDDDKATAALIKVCPTMFASMKYVDNSIMNCESMIHALNSAVLSSGLKSEAEQPELFIIDKIDSIIALSPASKDSTSICCLFRALKYNGKDNVEFINILSSFDMETKYNKKKFRGNDNPDKILNTYMKDSDQYATDFIDNCRIINMDKEFMIIKVYNKDKKYKLVALDNGTIQSLKGMIEQF